MVNDFFKHYLWKRHEHPTAWRESLPELITSDGNVVRRIVSQPKYIYFQAFKDHDTAATIVDRVESAVSTGMALLGYSMFADDAAVAILHTGQGNEPGWVAFPHKRIDRAVIPTLPMRVADFPKLRLLAGADMDWKNGKPRVVVALEQRGTSFQETDFALNLLDHIDAVSLHAQLGLAPDDRELRLVKRGTEPELNRVNDNRLEVKFEADEVIVREFGEHDQLAVWLSVQFDQKLLCLPKDWRSFWMSLSVPGLTRV